MVVYRRYGFLLISWRHGNSLYLYFWLKLKFIEIGLGQFRWYIDVHIQWNLDSKLRIFIGIFAAVVMENIYSNYILIGNNWYILCEMYKYISIKLNFKMVIDNNFYRKKSKTESKFVHYLNHNEFIYFLLKNFFSSTIYNCLHLVSFGRSNIF